MTKSYVTNLLNQGFKDAVVVVIGGKGGIGSEVVKQARQLGAITIVGSRSVEQLSNKYVNEYIPIDICDSSSVKQFAATIKKNYGRIDVLVNTAGLSYQLPGNRLDMVTDEIIDEVMQSNARGPLLVMREMADLLLAGNAPVIINLSSIAAMTGGGSNMVYAASKAALDTISKSVARALAPKVRVVNLAPSALDTDFVRNRNSDFIDATIKASALKRLATIEEIATSVICAARLLTATTGSTIFVDAGRHL